MKKYSEVLKDYEIRSEEYRTAMKQKLYDDFFFMRRNGRCFPIEFDNGWLDEFYFLCKKLYDGNHIKKESEFLPFGWCQLKSKFGTARCYYCGEITSEGAKLIDEFEDIISKNTCEFCGDKGELWEIDSWLYTLCDECASNLEKELNR